MISAESKELLQDFEKRMRFVNLIKYWLQRSKPREISELLHNDDDKTDNLILMVMVFIMMQKLRLNILSVRSESGNQNTAYSLHLHIPPMMNSIFRIRSFPVNQNSEPYKISYQHLTKEKRI